MKRLVVVGRPMSIEYPSACVALAARFEVVMFDFLSIGDSVERLRGREIYAAIFRLRTAEPFLVALAALHESGTRLLHCVSRDSNCFQLPNDTQAQLGLCGCIDLGQPADSVVSQLEHIGATCNGAAHREWSTRRLQPFDARFANGAHLDELDIAIVDLIAHGLSDKQIAHALHYSEQTVRNRVSQILKKCDLDNRTMIGIARWRSSFNSYVMSEDVSSIQ